VRCRGFRLERGSCYGFHVGLLGRSAVRSGENRAYETRGSKKSRLGAFFPWKASSYTLLAFRFKGARFGAPIRPER